MSRLFQAPVTEKMVTQRTMGLSLYLTLAQWQKRASIGTSGMIKSKCIIHVSILTLPSILVKFGHVKDAIEVLTLKNGD